MNNTFTHEEYKAVIDGWHGTMRTAIQAFESLPSNTPKEVKETVWAGLVVGLNAIMVEQNNHRNRSKVSA